MIKTLLIGWFLLIPSYILADHTLEYECQSIVLDAKGDLRSWRNQCRHVALTTSDSEGRLLSLTSDLKLLESSSAQTSDGHVEYLLQFDRALAVFSEITLTASGGFNQTLRFQNQGETGLSDVRFEIVVSQAPGSESQEEQTLASFIYGFGNLRILESGETWRSGLVLYVRHVAMKLQMGNSDLEYGTMLDSDGQPRAFLLELPDLPPGASASIEIHAQIVRTSMSEMERSGLGELMFHTVWAPLRTLSTGVESTIFQISMLIGSVGAAVVLFALIVRVLTYPLNRWSQRAQDIFNKAQISMAPKIAEAKTSLHGVEQSEQILKIYADHKISPLSGLKGSASLIVQLPILVAFFGVTTESDIFRYSEFLWINDLSSPDQFLDIGVHIPLLGSAINLLPLLLGLVGWFSTIRHPQTGRTGLWMNLLFTVLFYPFAAALVLYWVTVNVMQLLEREVTRMLSDMSTPK